MTINPRSSLKTLRGQPPRLFTDQQAKARKFKSIVSEQFYTQSIIRNIFWNRNEDPIQDKNSCVKHGDSTWGMIVPFAPQRNCSLKNMNCPPNLILTFLKNIWWSSSSSSFLARCGCWLVCFWSSCLLSSTPSYSGGLSFIEGDHSIDHICKSHWIGINSWCSGRRTSKMGITIPFTGICLFWRIFTTYSDSKLNLIII